MYMVVAKLINNNFFPSRFFKIILVLSCGSLFKLYDLISTRSSWFLVISSDYWRIGCGFDRYTMFHTGGILPGIFVKEPKMNQVTSILHPYLVWRPLAPQNITDSRNCLRICLDQWGTMSVKILTWFKIQLWVMTKTVHFKAETLCESQHYWMVGVGKILWISSSPIPC